MPVCQVVRDCKTATDKFQVQFYGVVAWRAVCAVCDLEMLNTIAAG
jgi:hypothetical protein